MKLSARLEPHINSKIIMIWEVSSLKFRDDWKKTDFYYEYPPFYKMKAVTQVENKIMHFSFNDSSVPASIKGSNQSPRHLLLKKILAERKTFKILYNQGI